MASRVGSQSRWATISLETWPGLRRALARLGVVGGTTTLAQTNPQTVMASWYYALTKRSALMGNFGWQNWQRFGEVDVTISSETNRQVTSDAGFHDTWHGALGAQHRFFRSWLLSAGLAYDSSPVSKFHRTPSLPFDEAWRFGVGLQYDWSRTLTVGVAYEFLNAGEAEIANLRRGPLTGTLQGKYPTNDIHF